MFEVFLFVIPVYCLYNIYYIHIAQFSQVNFSLRLVLGAFSSRRYSVGISLERHGSKYAGVSLSHLPIMSNDFSANPH